MRHPPNGHLNIWTSHEVSVYRHSHKPSSHSHSSTISKCTHVCIASSFCANCVDWMLTISETDPWVNTYILCILMLVFFLAIAQLCCLYPKKYLTAKSQLAVFCILDLFRFHISFLLAFIIFSLETAPHTLLSVSLRADSNVRCSRQICQLESQVLVVAKYQCGFSPCDWAETTTKKEDFAKHYTAHAEFWLGQGGAFGSYPPSSNLSYTLKTLPKCFFDSKA